MFHVKHVVNRLPLGKGAGGQSLTEGLYTLFERSEQPNLIVINSVLSDDDRSILIEQKVFFYKNSFSLRSVN